VPPQVDGVVAQACATAVRPPLYWPHAEEPPMNPALTAAAIGQALSGLRRVGGPLEIALVALAALLATVSLVPELRAWRRPALAVTAVALALGELLLVWFHERLWALAAVADPATGQIVGRVAVPLWVESEKLYVWALLVAVMGLLAKDRREELLPGVGIMVAVLTVGAALWGRPFSNPLPSFLGQYGSYLQAYASGVPQAAQGAYIGLESSRQYYYNTWYMWVHPPLLFLAYGAFAISFVATVRAALTRSAAFERLAYHWARLGYLPLTAGMLLGFPWAILAWSGESWWWSGKVNMSIMMWLLYTAYLHGRLYLHRRGMWRWVLALAALSFVVLVLTYLATYVVPGAHSYA
jgi:cytochrome c biogenesis factor